MYIKVKLIGTAEINGITTDTITLNELTVRQELDLDKQFKASDPERNLNYIALSAGCSVDDITKLTSRNYQRVVAAFFRLTPDEDVKDYITEFDNTISP